MPAVQPSGCLGRNAETGEVLYLLAAAEMTMKRWRRLHRMSCILRHRQHALAGGSCVEKIGSTAVFRRQSSGPSRWARATQRHLSEIFCSSALPPPHLLHRCSPPLFQVFPYSALIRAFRASSPLSTSSTSAGDTTSMARPHLASEGPEVAQGSLLMAGNSTRRTNRRDE